MALTISIISYMVSVGSPTARPPMALPSAFLEAMYSAEALDDGEEALVVAVEGLGGVEAVDAAVEPAVGELHGVFGVAVVGLAGSALVEGHDDVGSDDTLYVHHPFGGEEVAAAVDVGAEGATLVGDFAVFGK